MHWVIKYPDGAGVTIRWCDATNFAGRIASFGGFAGVRPEVELYAIATYLKFRSAQNNFAATVSSFEGWLEARSAGRECLALLEAWTVEDSPRLAGCLLLRSAWTGDVVVDFVVANLGLTRGPPKLSNIGLLLVHTAANLGDHTGAPLIWAETALHSEGWWRDLIRCPFAFIKTENVASVLAHTTALLKSKHVEFFTQSS